MNKATGKTEQYACLKCVEGAAPTAKKKGKGCALVPGAETGRDASALLFAVAVLLIGLRGRAR